SLRRWTRYWNCEFHLGGGGARSSPLRFFCISLRTLEFHRFHFWLSRVVQINDAKQFGAFIIVEVDVHLVGVVIDDVRERDDQLNRVPRARRCARVVRPEGEGQECSEEPGSDQAAEGSKSRAHVHLAGVAFTDSPRERILSPTRIIHPIQ